MIQAAGIWADGWFYISAVGFLISVVLFFFLLGQYRAAAEAEDLVSSDATDTSESDASVSTEEPLPNREEPIVESLVPISHEDHPKEESSVPIRSIVDEPPKESVVAPVVNGAVNHWETEIPVIKSELAAMHSDFKLFLQRYEAERGGASEREAALIERLGELAKALQRLKPASVQDQTVVVEPPVRKTKKVDAEPPKVEAPVVVAPAPAAALAAALPSAPVQKQEISADATMRMELEAIIDAQRGVSPAQESAAQTEAAAAVVDTAEAQAPEPKPRRGPVWPV